MNKLVTYVRDSVAELRKVTWPTKRQVIVYTAIVLALSAGTAIFFAILDYVFNLGLEKLI